MPQLKQPNKDGRDAIARPLKLVALEVPGSTIQTEYQELSDTDPQQAIDYLRTDSSAVARHAAAVDVQQVLYTGLPSLGKR